MLKHHVHHLDAFSDVASNNLICTSKSRPFIEGLTLEKTDGGVDVLSSLKCNPARGHPQRDALPLNVLMALGSRKQPFNAPYHVLAHACFIFPRLSLLLSSGPSALY